MVRVVGGTSWNGICAAAPPIPNPALETATMDLTKTATVLFALASTACVEEIEPPPEGAEAQLLKTYCHNGSCFDIEPGAGYTATFSNGRVTLLDGGSTQAVYDLDGDSMPAGPWVKSEWVVVDCHDKVMATFATATGLGVKIVDDFEFKITDGGALVGVISSGIEAHPQPPGEHHPWQ